jgi:nucleoside-diphosphate-sugar epimerase
VVWAAGRAGPDASHEETDRELHSTERIVQLAQAARQRTSLEGVDLHLLSSAGALFEGHLLGSAESLPEPRTAYARLKLQQESLARSAQTDLGVRIYRPSSVYGFIRQGRRLGLVSTLIYRGAVGGVTQLTVGPSTLRDYVFVGDVGNYLAAGITSPHPCAEPAHLVAGRALTVLQVVRLVEKVLRRPVYLGMRPDATNATSTTFSPAILPRRGWRPTPIEAGIRMVYDRWRVMGRPLV